MVDVWEGEFVDNLKDQPKREEKVLPWEDLTKKECPDIKMRDLADRIHLLLCQGDHKGPGPSTFGDQRTPACNYDKERWERAKSTVELKKRAYKAAVQVESVAKQHWLSGKKLISIMDQLMKVEL